MTRRLDVRVKGQCIRVVRFRFGLGFVSNQQFIYEKIVRESSVVYLFTIQGLQI